jgi:hypothetical protein
MQDVPKTGQMFQDVPEMFQWVLSDYLWKSTNYEECSGNLEIERIEGGGAGARTVAMFFLYWVIYIVSKKIIYIPLPLHWNSVPKNASAHPRALVSPPSIRSISRFPEH